MDSDAREGYDPPAAVRALPSWLLSQAARLGQEAVAKALADDHLRRQHFTVLAALAEHGPASQADIGRKLWIDRSDLHAIVVALETDALIKRAPDAADRRRNVVTITAKGRRALGTLEARIRGAQAELLAPLGSEERDQLIALLARVVA
jgi:DNA-binding MarR family transcriptional regulator